MNIDINTTYVTLPISEIVPNSWNPNSMPKKEFDSLVRDIERVGDNSEQPIIVIQVGENQYNIVDGEHRYRALKELGKTEAICIVEELDEAQARIKTIAMNKLRGEFDTTGLANVISDLKNEHSMTDEELQDELGYSKDEIVAFDSLVNFDFDSFGEALPIAPAFDDSALTSMKETMTLSLTDKGIKALKDLRDALASESTEEALLLAAKTYAKLLNDKNIDHDLIKECAEELL